MMPANLLRLAGIAVLLACSAFFSSAETTLLSLNPIHLHRIARAHPRAGERLRRLLTKPHRLLSSILIGNTIVNVVAAALAYVTAEAVWPGRGEAVAIPVMTAVLLVFGETAPKRFAMRHGEQLAVPYVRALSVIMRLLLPLRLLLEWVSAQLSWHGHAGQVMSEDEFLTVVEVGEEEGVLDQEERTMVDGIIRLEETQAKDVMTPRVDLIGIDLDDDPQAQERVARGVRFRYLPIYRDSPDMIEGFLDVPHFLLSGGHDIRRSTVPPFFVPETAPLDTLLAMFQRERRRVAVVSDEYGGTAGLVTRGDILDAIVTDVDNEFEDTPPDIQALPDQRWMVDGSTSLEDINYELVLNLEAEGADRIAGWIASQLERMPKAGDTVEAQGCRATVQHMRRHRVLQVLLERVGGGDTSFEDEGA